MTRQYIVLGDQNATALAAALRAAGKEAVAAVDIAAAPPGTVVVIPADPSTIAGISRVQRTCADIPQVPVVVVGDKVDERAAVAAFAAGATRVVAGGTVRGQVEAIVDPLRAHRDVGLDRGGPATLARVLSFLVERRATGEIAIETPDGPAFAVLRRGVAVRACFKETTGPRAVMELAGLDTAATWRFAFAPSPDLMPTVAPTTADPAIAAAVYQDLRAAGAVDDDVPGGRVLIVDDDRTLVKMYAKFLQRAGLCVATAGDGRAGFAEALRFRPDVVVTDIMMPESDGWDLLARLKDDARTRDARVMMLSCHGGYLRALAGIAAGADAYVDKGGRGEQIATQVLEVLAPLRTLVAAVDAGGAAGTKIDDVGPARLLAALAATGHAVQIDARDSWNTAHIVMARGRLASAEARVLGRRVVGVEALDAFLSLERGSAEARRIDDFGAPECASVAVAVDEAQRADNARREASRATLLAENAELSFSGERLVFYRRVCADETRAVLDSLVDGRSPRQLVVDDGANPLFVDRVVEDVLRKGIAELEPRASP